MPARATAFTVSLSSEIARVGSPKSFKSLAKSGSPPCAIELLYLYILAQILLEIDNSAAERALRAVALGRKNFLFVGSDCGGERAAAMYSLIGSAKLNGLDPEFYLRTVLARIADYPINHIQDLLPWNLAPQLQTLSQQAA